MIFFILIPCGILAWAFAIAKAAGLDISWRFCLSPIWVPILTFIIWWLVNSILDKRSRRV